MKSFKRNLWFFYIWFSEIFKRKCCFEDEDCKRIFYL